MKFPSLQKTVILLPYLVMVTTFLVTIYYLNINLVILTCNVVMVTKFKFHYTVVIVKVVNITRQCSDVHYIVFTVYY